MPRTFRWNWLGVIALAAAPTLALGQAPESHTVREGDTLWDLARQYRGDPFLWPDIYRLNTAVVDRPLNRALGHVGVDQGDRVHHTHVERRRIEPGLRDRDGSGGAGSDNNGHSKRRGAEPAKAPAAEPGME